MKADNNIIIEMIILIPWYIIKNINIIIYYKTTAAAILQVV